MVYQRDDKLWVHIYSRFSYARFGAAVLVDTSAVFLSFHHELKKLDKSSRNSVKGAEA